MTRLSAKLLLWSPRILGILVCLFLSLFALDAFSEGKGFVEALPGFAIYLTPALLLLAIVAASWRSEWIGATTFISLASAYAVMARHHIGWILVVSGPLMIVGVLFFWSWRHHERLHARM